MAESNPRLKLFGSLTNLNIQDNSVISIFKHLKFSNFLINQLFLRFMEVTNLIFIQFNCFIDILLIFFKIFFSIFIHF